MEASNRLPHNHLGHFSQKRTEKARKGQNTAAVVAAVLQLLAVLVVGVLVEILLVDLLLLVLLCGRGLAAVTEASGHLAWWNHGQSAKLSAVVVGILRESLASSETGPS